MPRFIFIAALVACTVIYAIAEETELYSDKYDYINYNEILSNDKLRNQYFNCFLDPKQCKTDAAKFLKRHTAEAYVTNCKKCTQKQKEILDTIATWYTTNRPDEWKAIVEKILEDVKAKHIQ